MNTTIVSKEIKQESSILLKKYQQNKNLTIRNKIMQLNFGLVRKEAYHWSNQCNETYEDLLQVGSMGLIRAIERFEIHKGYAFSSFAIPYIRGEIQHYLRDHSCSVRIPRRWLELRRQARSVTKNYQANLNRQPTDLEIAETLEVSLKEWQEIKLAYQNREPVSLDVSVGDEDNGKTNLVDLVPDPNYRSFELAREDRIRLQHALGQLEDRTRNVLEFVFLQDLTQKEAAERLGISVATVARRVKKGIGLLKKSMKE
ncbi:MAG: RNA polymerase sigma factor SigF [Prochloraceae cyanobacterium]|nr:RNA polymerase sigma factor SigF [Prochloraceae cyanobacterium]